MPSSQGRPAAAARSSLARAPVATRTRSAAMRSPDASLTPVARLSPSIAASRAPSRMSTPRARCSVSKNADTVSPATRFITRSSASTTVASRPSCAHHGRDLEPDVAAADDDDVPRIIERRAKATHVIDLAKREHARQVDAGQWQIARAGAGGEHQRVVGVARAVLRMDELARQIDAGDRTARARAGPCDRPSSFRGEAAACRSEACSFRNALDSGGR